MASRPLSGDPIVRVAIVVIASIALLAGLRLADDIFAPLVLSVVVGIIFAPVADRMDRIGIPRPVAVLVLMVLLFFAFAALAYLIEPYISLAIDQIPSVRYEIRKLLFEYRDLIRGIDEVNEQMSEALGNGDSEGDGGAAAMPGMTDALFLAPAILAQILIFLGGLFFFLLTRDNIYRWASRRIGSRADTAAIMERFCDAEITVSRYFATISVINAGLGFAVGGVLMAVGVPGAVIWGIGAALMNFILYLGPAAMAGGLLLTGVVHYDGLMTFAPPAIYLAINMTEAQFVTPSLVGRHVDINPFLLFVSLVFWLWLWGPLGGIVAIPVTVVLLKMFDIFNEHPTGP
ncbi:AI-2E family transporter [Salipiger mucosus]|uniref:AI-2E family transporter n=1 Tax=Salipiger mucosus DSM 16094 TaxID=1123237 RepID=S9R4F6_9RHOB|nr:AI-2E family transporter [Salipiger mucosus]EPX86807.1 hypothetical protein Salmuc_01456 [Salipiger mucosus DSM 16094]